MLCGLSAYAQRTFTTAELQAIQTASSGAEGDLYLNTDDGILWIGLQSGDLYRLSGTDDQRITQFDFNAATNEVYIALEDGGLDTLDLSALNSDNQVIDVSTFTASGLNLSLEDDGVPTIDIPLISTTADNDLSFNSDGLYINETDDQVVDEFDINGSDELLLSCLLYTSPSPRDRTRSRMPSSA